MQTAPHAPAVTWTESATLIRKGLRCITAASENCKHLRHIEVHRDASSVVKVNNCIWFRRKYLNIFEYAVVLKNMDLKTDIPAFKSVKLLTLI